MRVAEIMQLLEGNPESLDALAQAAVGARSGRSACRTLGLDYHPHICNLARNVKNLERSPKYSRVIYHSDPPTLYGPDKVELEIDHRPQFNDAPVAHAPVVPGGAIAWPGGVGSSGAGSSSGPSGPSSSGVGGGGDTTSAAMPGVEPMDVAKVIGAEEVEVLKSMLVSHLRQQLDRKADSFLAVEVSTGHLRTMRSILTQHQGGEVDIGKDLFEDAAALAAMYEPLTHYPCSSEAGEANTMLTDMLRNNVFLKVVHYSPKKLVRAPVFMESAMESADLAVQVHAVLQASDDGKQLALDHAPASVRNPLSGSGSLLFSPLILSLQALRSCQIWPPVGPLHYFLKRAVRERLSLPAELSELLPGVLDDLAKPSNTGYLEVVHGESKVCVQLLDLLLADGLVECNSNNDVISEWRLSPAGKASLIAGQCVESGRWLTEIRPAISAKHEDMNLWELFMCLQRVGWAFRVVAGSQKNKALPYVLGGPKVWYCSNDGPSCRYLLCLLRTCQGELKCSVPRFKADHVYVALLAGRVPEDRPAKRRKRRYV